jgi:hypothetical protein
MLRLWIWRGFWINMNGKKREERGLLKERKREG